MMMTSRLTLSVIAGAAMLSACGGSQPPIAATDSISQPAATQTKTFKYTGEPQIFTVPAGVSHVIVAASGAGSPSYSDGPSGPSSTGSNGGFVKATIPVTPGEKLAIFVGGAGRISHGGLGGRGGFNGGGTGGRGVYRTYDVNGGVGGGGASDIREGRSKLANRVLVAAGGGGGGVAVGYGAGAGGAGGGRVGGDGGGGCCSNPSGFGGLGGSQSAGGQGGSGGDRSGFGPGANGHRGKRGRGGLGGGESSAGGGGGGGGGGYYGGGGGGSSFVEPSATHVRNVQGGAGAGNGKIVISW
jgi:hypothetical protein